MVWLNISRHLSCGGDYLPIQNKSPIFARRRFSSKRKNKSVLLVIRPVSKNMSNAIDTPCNIKKNNVSGEETKNKRVVYIFIPKVYRYSDRYYQCEYNIKRFVVSEIQIDMDYKFTKVYENYFPIFQIQRI